MTNKLAAAYDKIAEGFAEAALAIEEAAVSPQEPSGALPSMKVEAETSWTETDEWADTPQARSQGGGCPIHGLPWVVRPAGTSKKTGAPYNAFWHCNEQNDDGSFCQQKPTAAWVKAHPIR